MRTPFSWIAVLIVMNLFWAGTSVVVKVGVSSLDPLALIFWRFVVAFVVLAGVIIFRKTSIKIGRRNFIRIIGTGLLMGVSNWLWVKGIEMSFAADASLLFVIEPIWGIILASIVFRERLIATTLIGLGLVLAGIVALSNFDPKAFGFEKGEVAAGNLLVVASLMLEGCYSILIKPLSGRVSAPLITALNLAAAIFVISIPMAIHWKLPLPSESGAYFAIGYLAIIGTVAGYTLWISIMKHVPIGVMMFTIFIQPVVGPFIAFFALGEKIDTRVLTGGFFLTTGVLVAIVGHLRASQRNRLLRGEAAPLAGSV